MVNMKWTRSWKHNRGKVCGADSGVCELTNQSRLGVQERGLKETGATTTFETEGEYSVAVWVNTSAMGKQYFQ